MRLSRFSLSRNEARLATLCLAVISFVPSVVQGHVYAGFPHCPTNKGDTKYTWVDYLTGTMFAPNHAFSIVIDQVEHPVGPIPYKQCLSSGREASGLHISLNDANMRRDPRPTLLRGTAVNAADLSFIIAGRTLSFNAVGDLFDSEYGLVGRFVCPLGPQCVG